MITARRAFQLLATTGWLAVAGSAVAAEASRIPEPAADWSGKDAAWVPTPPILVDKMLDMAQVTP